jgi:hypothetical protein
MSVYGIIWTTEGDYVADNNKKKGIMILLSTISILDLA